MRNGNGLSLLFFAVLLAATALSAVGFFADRVERGLEAQGAAALAADLVLESSRPIPEVWLNHAQQNGLQIARTITFPTVLLIEGKPQLVQVKGVDNHYPLRGDLKIQRDGVSENLVPAAGHAAAARRFFDAIDQTSVTVSLGKKVLQVDGLLQQEPDPGSNLFQLAPRLMVAIDDVMASELLGPASRAHYRLLVAGARKDVQGFQQWVNTKDVAGVEIITLDSGRPEIASAVDRARRFLGLAALCASLLAGVGIMLATRHLVSRSMDAVAILRTLGMTSWQVLSTYLRKLLQVTLAGSLLGGLCGYLLQYALTSLVADFLDGDLPPPGWEPLSVVVLHALILVGGFSLPILMSLLRVTPLRVLRQDLAPAGLPQWLVVIIAISAFYLLLHWQAADFKLANQIALGLAILFAVYAMAGFVLLRSLRPLGRKIVGLAMGLASMGRYPGVMMMQLGGYALSITVLLLLTLVRGEVTEAWKNSLPEEAPNYFLVNIQPVEVTTLKSVFSSHGIKSSVYYPTARGRLKTINSNTVVADNFDTSRARRLANREFSLGFGEQLQTDNKILQGRWWLPGESAFSVEEGLAKALGLSVGDILDFDIAGERIRAPITSIRKVAWDSFNVNFFVQGSPALLDGLPYAVITSLYLSEQQLPVLTQLAREYPAVSAIHLGPLLKLVKDVISRSALAVQGLFLFTLAAAVLVTIAMVQVSRDQRQKEVAILRTLGASNGQVLWSVLSEYLVLGIAASALAVMSAHFAGAIIAESLFDLPMAFSPLLWLVGLLGGTLSILLIGYFAVKPILQTPPMRVLK